MTKYQEYFEKMLTENKPLFENFRNVHQKYTLDQTIWQSDFNEAGSKIVDVIRDYENRLCANTERGMYTKFSGGLSEKFWNLIRKDFPLIDNVGLIVDSKPGEKNLFNIKKISLN